MTTTTATTTTTTTSSSLLLWPPPTCQDVTSNKNNGEETTTRVDLLALIPPNRFDDLNLPHREQQVAGLTLRADRVIMDRERYSDCDRMTQHKLSDDIQASCREQGHVISVKEWADKNQHRGTLRLRLRCRSSACRFQFQLNWDSKAGFWYISRRRCGTFVHTCQPVQGGAAATTATTVSSTTGKRLRTATTTSEKPASSHKRSKHSKSLTSKSNKSNNETVLDALDSARSLLDLSRSPSSPAPPSSPTPGSAAEASPTTSPVAATATPSVLTPAAPDFVRLGDRLFIPGAAAATSLRPTPPLPSLLAAASAPSPAAAAALMQHKLALLRAHQQAAAGHMDLTNAAALKAAVLQQRCMAGLAAPAPAQHQALLHHHDPRLLRTTGLLLNGGAFANI